MGGVTEERCTKTAERAIMIELKGVFDLEKDRPRRDGYSEGASTTGPDSACVVFTWGQAGGLNEEKKKLRQNGRL